MFYIGNMPGESPSSQINNYITDGRLDYWNASSQNANGYKSTIMWSNVQSPISGTVLPFITKTTLAMNEIPVPTAQYCMSINPNETIPTAITYVTVSQRIEQVRTLAGKEATLSFWMSANAANTTVEIIFSQHYAGSQVAAVTQLVSADTTLDRHFVSFSVPPLQSLPSDEGYIEITFKFSNLSTYKLACIQLEEGASATDFEELTPQEAAFRLNRYYFSSSIAGVYSYGAYNSGQVQTFVLPLPTVMRALPTVTLSGLSIDNGTGSAAASSPNSVLLTVTSSGITPPEPTVPPAASPPFPSPTTVSATFSALTADARI